MSAKVRQLLQRMHELAMMLRERRFAAGALELHLPEVKIDFNEEGEVTGAHATEHDESHQIIEEFMLAANIA
ncbi:MAG: RNB domain-containing ribonuclease, partial [Planctomycetaceae bacterium]|nr:RNB domain-containing ribonuclease [Planctomycetaceae bacterium]